MQTLEELRKRMAEDGSAPQGMSVHTAKGMKVTASEIRAACEANPEHPVAKIYGKAAKDRPDDYLLSVEVVDLQALLENREVTTEGGIEGGVKVTRKKLGPKIAAPEPEKAPAPAKPKAEPKPAEPAKP